MNTILKFFWVLLGMVSTCAADTKTPQVVVVGAGIAGLTTAYRLQQKGVDVHVYEARGRVGGRIFTAVVGGERVELGGHNITDGGSADHLRSLIQEMGLELRECRFPPGHAYFDGTALMSSQELYGRGFEPEGLRVRLFELSQKSQNMQEVLQGLFEEDDPLYKLSAVRLAVYEGAPVEKLSPLYAETLYYMLLGGASAAHQGSENGYSFVDVEGGNARLPEQLAKVLGERVHLHMPLAAVSKESDGSYELTFGTGEKVRADILVLAMPCSVYHNITFAPGVIPEEKLKAIQNVQYGTNAKIVIPCAELTSVRVLNDRMGSFSFPESKNLVFYYTGESGRFGAETLQDTYTQDWPMIEKAVGAVQPVASVVTIARDTSFATYEGVVGWSWPEDPYARGSYSYIAPGQERLLTTTHLDQGERVKSLFAPIDQTLYFVGEHASVLMDVPGTMEAACESGERIARMVDQVMRR